METHSIEKALRIVSLAEIKEAQARLRGIAVRTEVLQSHLSQDGCANRKLYLKPENLQPIGSFKLRGAYNKIASLSDEERHRGVISYSSGNHAQGVAYAARALGVKALIVMPNNAPAIKREATAALGAEIVQVGPASSERQAKAEQLAAEHGYVIIPPYNDEKIIGVEPELAAAAQASLRAGKIIQFSAEQVTRTMADGLRTQSVGTINFEHIRRYVDDIVTVTEDEIRQAMRLLAADPKTTAEPSGAVAVAAFLFHRDELPQTSINVAVISGGNIDPKMLAEIRS